MIENNILAISNAMFKNKKDWSKVTDDQKEQFFFIFNRYFSKKYLELSSLLNDKKMNYIQGMDLWYKFMENKSYPQWFWSKSKSKNKNDENEINYNQKQMLIQKYGFNDTELEFLIKHHRQEVIEEIDYLKKLTK